MCSAEWGQKVRIEISMRGIFREFKKIISSITIKQKCRRVTLQKNKLNTMLNLWKKNTGFLRLVIIKKDKLT